MSLPLRRGERHLVRRRIDGWDRGTVHTWYMYMHHANTMEPSARQSRTGPRERLRNRTPTTKSCSPSGLTNEGISTATWRMNTSLLSCGGGIEALHCRPQYVRSTTRVRAGGCKSKSHSGLSSGGSPRVRGAPDHVMLCCAVIFHDLLWPQLAGL